MTNDGTRAVAHGLLADVACTGGDHSLFCDRVTEFVAEHASECYELRRQVCVAEWLLGRWMQWMSGVIAVSPLGEAIRAATDAFLATVTDRAEVERLRGVVPGAATATLSHHWRPDFSSAAYPNVLHDSATDAKLEQVRSDGPIAAAVAASGANDGDEIEITVKVTGRRPFGDRRVRLVRPHEYERETAAGTETTKGEAP